jgi:glycosyltransferase involved in cell wall biosynthesis
MACGTPVITSSTSSLPEVVGDAAVTVDPEDTAAIAEAMLTLANDASMCARLREAGIARARQFSWHRTAELTAQAYRRVMGA